MRLSRTISAFALAVGLAGAACSSGEGPTNIEIPIAELRITNACPGMVEGNTCTLFAEAKTEQRAIVPNPVLRWFSSSSSVASVQENGGSALVTALGQGTATITVTNSSQTVSDFSRVTVLFCSKC
ncbi:MAG: Ig-like domain-containing protein [Gemmatimonadota bacterium]